MRIAMLADIHANLEALQSVLMDIDGKGGVDEMWCLGDIVGYGPEPMACLRLLEKHNFVCIAGNHDLGAAGKLDLDYFNPAAAEACRWTGEVMNPVDLRYLEDLPRTLKRGDFTLAHGSPLEPLFEYLTTSGAADKNLEFFETAFCVVGHTHVPLAFKREEPTSKMIPLHEGIGLVMMGHRFIINPGAVGQPRDGDPRASYGIYESEGHMFRVYRVPYNIRATQDRMMERGLPITLVTRLEQGK